MINECIMHFSDEFTDKQINDILGKNEKVVYYTKSLPSELHIINHRKGGIKITQLMIELINYYKKNNDIKTLLSTIKMRGNDEFTIISNIDIKLITKIKSDLNKLLK